MAELNLSALQRIEALLKSYGGTLPEPIQTARAERIAVVDVTKDAPTLEAELEAALSGMAKGSEKARAAAYAQYLAAFASHETRAQARTRLEKAAEARIADVAREHRSEIVAAVAGSDKVKSVAATLSECAPDVPLVVESQMLQRSATEVIAWKRTDEAMGAVRNVARTLSALYNVGEWTGDAAYLLLWHKLPELQSYADVDAYVKALNGTFSMAGQSGVGDGTLSKQVSPVALLARAGVTEWGLQTTADASRQVQQLARMRQGSYWTEPSGAADWEADDAA